MVSLPLNTDLCSLGPFICSSQYDLPLITSMSAIAGPWQSLGNCNSKVQALPKLWQQGLYIISE